MSAGEGVSVRKDRLDYGQIYGYTVCLLAILTFLFSTARLVGAVLDIRELPYSSSYSNGPSLVSPGAYRIDLLARIGVEDASGTVASALPPDSTWDRMFEAERQYRLALSYQRSRRTIVISLVLVTLAVLLFSAHWQWLRSRESTTA